jgi:hypothetical protein
MTDNRPILLQNEQSIGNCRGLEKEKGLNYLGSEKQTVAPEPG